MRNCCSTLRHAYRCSDAEARLLQMSPNSSPELTSPVEMQAENTTLKNKMDVQTAGQSRIETATQEVRRLNIDELLTPLTNAPELQNTADPLRWVGHGLPRQVDDGAPVNPDLTLSAEPIPPVPKVRVAEPLQQLDYAAIAADTDTAPPKVATPDATPNRERLKSTSTESATPKSNTETSTTQPNAATSAPTSGTESLSGNISQAEQQAALSGARQELQGKNPATMTEAEVQKLLGQTMLRYGVIVSVENGAFRVEAPRTSMDKMINILMGAVSYFTAIANELGERMGKKRPETKPADTKTAETSPEKTAVATKDQSSSEPEKIENEDKANDGENAEKALAAENVETPPAQPKQTAEQQALQQMNDLSAAEGVTFRDGEFLVKLSDTTIYIRYNAPSQKWQIRTDEQPEWTSNIQLQHLEQSIQSLSNSWLLKASAGQGLQQTLHALQMVKQFNDALDAAQGKATA